MTIERFQKQAESFISETLTSAIPGTTVDPGSAVNNIMVRGGGAIASGLFQEIDHTLTTRDISAPEAISITDMDRNLEPLLVTRDSGEISRGFVNLYFSDRRARTVAQGTRATTADKLLNYVVDSDLAYEPSDYLVEPSDNSFYLRVPFSAEKAGSEYDSDVGVVNTLVGDRLGVLYARNTEKFLGGLAAQTNTAFVATAKRAVSTRTPLNVDGTILTLQKLFGTKILDALIIGNGDPEMLRDELYDQAGVLALGPAGTPTGVHIGGRTDAYHWYPQVNYVEVTIDLTIDLITATSLGIGAATIQAKFAPGTTTTNTVPASGALIIDLGGAGEETVRYSSFVFFPLTGLYVFTLVGLTTIAHNAAVGVKVAGSGGISVGPTGAIKTLPMLKVQSVRTVDPLTLAPIGDPLTEVTAAERTPGWYFEDFNKLNFMSAKETRTLRIDEKRLAPGNQPLSKTDGVTSAVRLLASATTNFTGYQGRDITINDGVVTVTRTILRVISPTQVEYSDGPETLVNGAGRTWSVAAGYKDFLQYPVRVSFYTHTEIQDAQASFDGGRTRIVCSDILSRIFLPLFLDFTLRFKGSGSVADVRKKILTLIQQAQGTNFGSNQGARFDVSDIVAAAYSDGLADAVETPFQIKVTHVNVDGSKTVRWVAPSLDTVNELVLSVAAGIGDTVITATRPVQVPASNVPARGKLFLGAFYGNQETVTYERVVFSGANMIFVLTEGQTVQYVHAMSEPLRVSVVDYDPANVITDGVISDERQFRPYFGTVVVEKIA